jgi:hypothetical protein
MVRLRLRIMVSVREGLREGLRVRNVDEDRVRVRG